MRLVKSIFTTLIITIPMLGCADELTLDAFDLLVSQIVPEQPVDKDPLKMGASIVAVSPGLGDSVIVALKLRLLPGWYIYEKVPPGSPFFESEWILDIGPELSVIDEWAGPPSTPHKDLSFTRVHEAAEQDLLFFREMKVSDVRSAQAALSVGLKYQICNAEFCLAPKTKSKQLSVELFTGSNE